MVEPFYPVLIALVDGVYPNITRLAAGLRLASLADGGGAGAGFVKLAARSPVGAGSPQVVNVRYGNAGQPLVVGKTKQLPGALTELFGGWPREGAMQFIQLGQKASISVRILAGKAVARAGRG